MSTRVDESVEIRSPRADVARYMFDWRNDPEWIGGISEARHLGEGELRVGSRVARVASFLGRRIEYVLEVEELEPDAQLSMRSVAGPFPMTSCTSWPTRRRRRARGSRSAATPAASTGSRVRS